MTAGIVMLVANWLDSTFDGFDRGILEAMHILGEATDYYANYFFKFISLLAEKGLGMIVLSLLMILIPLIPAVRNKNRDVAGKIVLCGVAALTAMALGLLVTNYTIKPWVARLRPYNAQEIYRSWWQLAGGKLDNETSFPSGHTTCTMAMMTSVFMRFKKKYSWTAFIFVVLMGLSRNYLMMHYPTDIIGGMIVGGTMAAVASLFWQWVWKRAERKVTEAVSDNKEHDG